MIQPLIDDRFGVFSNVFSSAQLLKNLALAFNKRPSSPIIWMHTNASVADTTWPQRLRRAQARQALLLCGEEASFPQWGTLTSTWARRGQQPKVKTCASGKAIKSSG